MEQSLTDKTFCVVLRCGIELWITDAEAKTFVALIGNDSLFVHVNGNFISRHEIRGVFSSEAVAEMRRRKNGEWQARNGSWHMKDERVCACGNVLAMSQRCGYCSAT